MRGILTVIYVVTLFLLITIAIYNPWISTLLFPVYFFYGVVDWIVVDLLIDEIECEDKKYL